MTAAPGKVITIKNASTCNAYELRQELLRRNAFDLDENTVNFRSMLQRLMVELVAEEKAQTEQKTETLCNEANAVRDAAKTEREKKKQEALERSKQRQADASYFARRAESNEEAKSKKAAQEAQALATALEREEAEGGQSSDPFSEDQDGVENDDDDDPFRTVPKKGRQKIFVK
mmetsp:Transcript_2576/g.4534  ORF Transcript_2576/g.4534 Transcript_2576/m.4534 type:complete len:174 (-) Transcript_2576:92-613(-)